MPNVRPPAGPALTATYRLQLGPHLDFDGARALVPYLARLGVSHLYLSPVLAARPGSTHGYDVVDPTRANPALGGDAAFDRLADAARDRGLGVVLDVVPNHMGAGPDNPFWDDVLAYGEASPYARWFDVDWEAFARRGARQIVLPVLGDELETALGYGHVTLHLEPRGFRVHYFEHSLPLDPRTAHRLFAFAHAHAFGDAADADAVRAARDLLFAEGGESIGRDRAERGVRTLAEAAAARPAVRAYVEAALAEFAAGPDGRTRLQSLLDLQAWRVTFWRRAWRELNYRRFFDVSDLVALRAEDPAVFEATHAWALERVAAGRVQALRIDHVDGLRDPLAYLRRLRGALDARSPGPRVPVFVEKILVGHERLRAEWPVDGTTGYEALNTLESVFVDRAGSAALARALRRELGARSARFEAEAVRGKEYVLRRSFRPEIRRAVRALLAVARGEAPASGAGGARGPALAEAVLELAAELPVYRTYVVPAEGSETEAAAAVPGPLVAGPEDRALVSEALAHALARTAIRAGTEAERADALRLAAGALVGDVPNAASPAAARVRRGAAEFALRFQQTSGPATAKGVEDTALYRWAPLLSLCEVGGEPGRPLGGAVGALHAACVERQAHTPHALVAVTTHDTKRSADVRARLDALSEIAPEWRRAVGRWRERHAPLRAAVDGRPAPDATSEWQLYQTLAGIWPAGGEFPGGTTTADEAFAARVYGYLEKSAREAKLRTSWTSTRPDYERGARAFAEALLVGPEGAEFRAELVAILARVAPAGAWTSLARTALAAWGPGTPDVYNGDELWFSALVDPDNRRAVDWGARERLLAEAEADEREGGGDPAAWWAAHLPAAATSDGAVKLRLLRAALGVRAAYAGLFVDGAYRPLVARGPGARHVVAFARATADRAAIVVAPRLVLTLAPDGAPPVGAVWRDTTLVLPPDLARLAWGDVLTGRFVRAASDAQGGGGTFAVADTLAAAPVALLRSLPGV